jgi:transcriptional regulator with XRE-family HTH domain
MAEVTGSARSVDCRIGARLRLRRERVGLSVEAVAAELGCGPEFILDLESGRARAGATTLMLLTQILDVDLGYLLGGLVDEAPPLAVLEQLARDKLMP